MGKSDRLFTLNKGRTRLDERLIGRRMNRLRRSDRKTDLDLPTVNLLQHSNTLCRPLIAALSSLEWD